MSLSFAPMYSYATKRVAVIIMALSSVLLLLLQLFQKGEQMVLGFEIQNVLLAVLLLSLFGVVGSKEKVDDERVVLIRGKAFYYAFMLLSSTLAAFSIIQVLGLIPLQNITGMHLLMFVFFSQIIYLLVFYSSLILGAEWVYEDHTLLDQIKKHHWFYLSWILISALLLIIFFFFL